MRQRKNFLITGASLALGALVLAGCSGGSESAGAGAESNAAADSDDPIKVIVFGGVGAEGVLADNATTSVTSAHASAAAVNEAGGVLGREVEIIDIDDTGDPTVAVTKLREVLAEEEEIVAAANSGPSPIADATLPILAEEGILSFNIAPTSDSDDPAVNPYNFDLSPAPADYIRGFLPTMEEEGYEKVAILNGDDPYGNEFAAQGETIFSEEGYEVTEVRNFDTESLDMTPQLSALEATDPDVLVLDAYGAPVLYVLEGLEKLGWDVPVLGNNSVTASPATSTEAPTGLLGTDLVDNLRMQAFNSTVKDSDDTETVEAVEQMVDAGEIRSTLILAYNYDTMWLIKQAAEDAQSLEAEDLAAALEKQEVQQAADTVILQNYNFTADSHSPQPDADEFQFISPGPLVNGQFDQ